MAGAALFFSSARFLNVLTVVSVLHIHITDSYTGRPLEAGMIPDFPSIFNISVRKENYLERRIRTTHCTFNL